MVGLDIEDVWPGFPELLDGLVWCFEPQRVDFR
jgi:hypothetical protein